MGNQDDLGRGAHFSDQLIKAADIRIIKRRINLILDTERTRANQKQRKSKTERGQRLLSTRQQLE